MRRRSLPLAVCLCAGACRTATEPPPAFVAELARAARGFIVRDGEAVVETGVLLRRPVLQREVEVAAEAVQPGGLEVAWERVWRGDRELFRARTRYAAPVGVRTVLVQADGTVVERTHEVGVAVAGSDQDLAPALAALAGVLGGAVDRLEIVHGPGGREWVRGHRGSPPDARIADCALPAGPCTLLTVEWLDGGMVRPAAPERPDDGLPTGAARSLDAGRAATARAAEAATAGSPVRASAPSRRAKDERTADPAAAASMADVAAGLRAEQSPTPAAGA